MSKLDKVSISKNEYDALNMIEGLDQEVFYMVVAAKKMKDGTYVLEANDEVFDKLASDLSDEIYYKMSPKKRLKYLSSLYDKINPECGDF